MNAPTQTDAAPPPPHQSNREPYELREKVCLREDLPRFSQLLFCRLTDLAFKPGFRRRDGEIEASKKFLSEQFRCSPDTVTRAAKALESAGFIWTHVRWTGAHEMTWWYIREWADPQLEFFRHTGTNFGRRQGGVQRNTNRGQKGKFALNPESKRQKERAALAAAAIAEFQKTTVKAEISPAKVHQSSLTGLTSQPCQGASISPDSVQDSALTGLTSQPCQGASISPDSVQDSALTGLTNQPCQGAGMSGLSTLRDDYSDGESSNRLGNRSQGAATPAKKAKRKPTQDENEFMATCTLVFGVAEMATNGGGWRKFYWKDTDHAWSVVNETRSAVTERRISTTPAKYANNLRSKGWLRPSGPSPEKPKAERPMVTMQPEKGKRPEVSPATLAALKEVTR